MPRGTADELGVQLNDTAKLADHSGIFAWIQAEPTVQVFVAESLADRDTE